MMEILFNSASVLHNGKKGPREEKENMKTEL